MSKLTEHQREIILRRVSRAIRWAESDQYQRDAAERLARAVVAELEISCVSAAAQRRAVLGLVENLEAKTA